MENHESPSPHVLIFPLPAQGHVNSMLNLAELLCLADLKVTFLNSTHNHLRLLQHTDIQTRFSRYKGFRLEAIPDGLPEDHPRSGRQIMDIFKSIIPAGSPILKEILLGSKDERISPITCFIVDGAFAFCYDIAEEVGVPVIAFRTISACAFWVYFCIPKLIEDGVLPFKDNEDMDELVKVLPGTETFLRRRDLPSFCQIKDLSDQSFQQMKIATQRTKQANSLILNTFEELEGPILSLIRKNCSSTVYPIGPLHAHLKYRLQADETPSSRNSSTLWQVDRSCIAWLDEKPANSVIYVSFGSLTVLSRAELREFWTGLVQSKKLFLWVVRPDSVTGAEGDNPTPLELVEGTKERGYLVSWAPQEEVLAHPAVGGFLTHSGWNSTMESIVAGVPMACWPFFADQQVNSSYVNKVWKVGMDMKDTCDRATVAKMVRDLIEGRRDELARKAGQLSRSAKSSIAEGGSSSYNLQNLIQDIRAMNKKTVTKTTSI
ncbi:hypothetical protein Dimus_011949 [Dionaea muscipula]